MGASESREDSDVAALRAKREAAALRKLPLLQRFEPNPFVRAMASKSFGGGGGGQLSALWKGATHKREHEYDFVCVCRVTGERKQWRKMTDKQNNRWVRAGDLTVAAAEAVIAEEGLEAIESGEERLAAVYRVLASRGL